MFTLKTHLMLDLHGKHSKICTQPKTKRVDLQLKFLQQKLNEGGDVLECISKPKNIKQDISKAGFTTVYDSLMRMILIAGLSSSYKHFLETLQMTEKLEKVMFDQLSELLTQHDKTFRKKKQVGEDVFFRKASTSKPSTQSSRGRGAQFSNIGHGNQDQSVSRGQRRGRSQGRGRVLDLG
jgi:hypothetical protein